MTRRKTPAHLGPSGARFWREVTKNFTLRDDERRILDDAAAEIDLIDSLAEEQRLSPLTVKGSQGQLVIHPLISELRQHRATLAGLLKQLALPDEETAPGSQPLRSVAARGAAHSRWHGTPSGMSGGHR